MANEVEFHTGVADPIDFVCRLLRKANRQGVRVLVTAPPNWLAELDAALWAFDAQEFLPHLRLTDRQDADHIELTRRTPIWLAERVAESFAETAAPDVVVNVGAAAPGQPAKLVRLIEVVGAEATVAEHGRERWRAYRVAGLRITHHTAAQDRG